MNAKRIAKIKKILADDDLDRARQVDLTDSWSTCPAYWRNFIRSLDCPDDDTDWERANSINYALREYNAIKEPGTVIFDTPKHKTWFIMRWA